MRDDLRHLLTFSGWLAERHPGSASRPRSPRAAAGYMLGVWTGQRAAGTKAVRVGSLRAVSEEQREDGLTGLPRSAMIQPRDPQGRIRLPPGVEGLVFDQFVDPENLALLAASSTAGRAACSRSPAWGSRAS